MIQTRWSRHLAGCRHCQDAAHRPLRVPYPPLAPERSGLWLGLDRRRVAPGGGSRTHCCH